MADPLLRMRSMLRYADLRTAAPRTDAALARLARGGGPIAAGPWLSEVGFEVLYWLPFLAWFADRYEVAPDRLVAVTRGGAGCWYGGLCSEAADVFELFTPEEFKDWNRRRVALRASQKQFAPAPMERDVVRRLLGARGLDPDAPLLHPSVMYRLFAPFWDGWQPLSRVRGRTRNQPLRSEGGDRVGLLEELDGYVAVKFYFSDCFPDTPENQALVRRLLAALTERHDVVLLSTGIDLDDHSDFETLSAPRVHTLSDQMTPANNLEVQTQAIAGARALIGTYGGFSYLGPFLGVPSYSFFSEENFVPAHLDVMRRALADLRPERARAGFVAEHTADAQVLADLLAGATASAAP